MIVAHSYNSGHRLAWDAFIDGSKNGTFMLKRDYVEYHADRFIDASIVFCDDSDAIVAVLPASRHADELRSHGGLTYGGIIVDKRMTAAKMLEVFDALKDFLRKKDIARLIYKRVPPIYYNYPSDEDLYALFRNGAKLFRRDLSTAIDLHDPLPFSSVRTRYAKKACKMGLEVRESDDYEQYVAVLTDVLKSRHNVRPPHTADELRLLASRFPQTIKLFCAYRSEVMLAGVLIFDTPQVVHAQYIANSEEGRKVGALDLVMEYLVNAYALRRRYFDFGISTEDGGRILNEGLVGQKEMFGGRSVVYDFYELEVVNEI